MSLVRLIVYVRGITSYTGVDSVSAKDATKVINHFVIVQKVLDTILSSREPNDLCRQIVHGDYVPSSTVGCALFYLDGTSLLRPIASYGRNPIWPNNLSAWDNHPPSEAVRKKRIVSGRMKSDDLELMVIAFPLISSNFPCGAMALVLEDLSLKVELPEEILELYFKLGAFYLESLNFGNLSRGTGANSNAPEDLTARQLTILSHMDNELVNHEIAKILMLSESTIRQETVRIYRALGVGNRQEAVKKARGLGLLPKSPPPPSLLPGV
jgi:hypothetical protein